MLITFKKTYRIQFREVGKVTVKLHHVPPAFRRFESSLQIKLTRWLEMNFVVQNCKTTIPGS